MILTEPGAGPPTLPPEELAEARGLAFASVHKGGAFVSGTSGHGFVIRKARCLLTLCWCISSTALKSLTPTSPRFVVGRYPTAAQGGLH